MLVAQGSRAPQSRAVAPLHTCRRAVREYPIALAPATPPTTQYQAGVCVSEPWCTRAPATVALPSMLAPMQWVGTLESLCSCEATTDAPTTTAAAAQQCVGMSGILSGLAGNGGGEPGAPRRNSLIKFGQ